MFGTIVLGTIIATAVMIIPLFFVALSARDKFGFAMKWIGWMLLANFILNSFVVYFFTPGFLLVKSFGDQFVVVAAGEAVGFVTHSLYQV